MGLFARQEKEEKGGKPIMWEHGEGLVKAVGGTRQEWKSLETLLAPGVNRVNVV